MNVKHHSLIVTANFGTLKAYRIEERSLKHRGACVLIRKTEYEPAHKKLSELLTDRAGRFRGSGLSSSPNRSFGEKHNLKTDVKQKVVKQLAHDIDGLIKQTPAANYFLSLPKILSAEVVSRLSSASRSKITKYLSADIVKEPISAIRAHFDV